MRRARRTNSPQSSRRTPESSRYIGRVRFKSGGTDRLSPTGEVLQNLVFAHAGPTFKFGARGGPSKGLGRLTDGIQYFVLVRQSGCHLSSFWRNVCLTGAAQPRTGAGNGWGLYVNKFRSSTSLRYLFTKNISGSSLDALDLIVKLGFFGSSGLKSMSPMPNMRDRASRRAISSSRS